MSSKSVYLLLCLTHEARGEDVSHKKETVNIAEIQYPDSGCNCENALRLCRRDEGLIRHGKNISPLPRSLTCLKTHSQKGRGTMGATLSSFLSLARPSPLPITLLPLPFTAEADFFLFALILMPFCLDSVEGQTSLNLFATTSSILCI